MGNHTLQFLTGQTLHASPRHSDHRIRRLGPSGKGIDTLLLIHQEDLRNRHPRSDSHFLNDIQQTLFLKIRRARHHQSPTQIMRDHFPATPELHCLEKTGNHNNSGGREGDHSQKGHEILSHLLSQK